MKVILSSWIISIVGIVVLGVLMDLIMPDGEMRKYIKSIFSVFVVFIMINPVLKIDINKIDFNKFIYNESSVEINQNFLNNYNKEYKQSLELICEENLKNAGFSGVEVVICLDLSKTSFEIEKVKLDLKNLVINTNMVHIDKYKEMRNVVVSLLDLKEEKVVFDGWRKEKINKTNG